MTSVPDDHELRGAIFEDTAVLLTLAELSRLCAVDETHIVEFVDEGVLHVVQLQSEHWQFSRTTLRRARLAVRLQRDLELNLPGLALALDLMEEIDALRLQLGVRR